MSCMKISVSICLKKDRISFYFNINDNFFSKVFLIKDLVTLSIKVLVIAPIKKILVIVAIKGTSYCEAMSDYFETIQIIE